LRNIFFLGEFLQSLVARKFGETLQHLVTRFIMRSLILVAGASLALMATPVLAQSVGNAGNLLGGVSGLTGTVTGLAGNVTGLAAAGGLVTAGVANSALSHNVATTGSLSSKQGGSTSQTLGSTTFGAFSANPSMSVTAPTASGGALPSVGSLSSSAPLSVAGPSFGGLSNTASAHNNNTGSTGLSLTH
jgi:hypothetical protein